MIVKTLISGTPGYGCAGAWRSMEETLEQIGRDLPDVLLVDIGLPGVSGTEGIRQLKQRYPTPPALVLTVCRRLRLPVKEHAAAGGQAGDRAVSRLSPA